MATRHRVIEVVHADDRHVDIPPRRVDEMIPTDGRDVSVSAENDHLQFGIREFESCGERNGPAVRRVE